jgi:hypothetical protein
MGRSPNTVCPQGRGIHAANAFALDSSRVPVEDQLIGPRLSLRCEAASAKPTRWANA